jgi:hypothetical protein
MRHPFQGIPFGIASIVLALLVAIATAIAWYLNKIGQPLKIQGIAPQGILSLEFALTAEKAKQIVEAWSKANVLDQAIKLQWIDFLFMAAYST